MLHSLKNGDSSQILIANTIESMSALRTAVVVD